MHMRTKASQRPARTSGPRGKDRLEPLKSSQAGTKGRGKLDLGGLVIDDPPPTALWAASSSSAGQGYNDDDPDANEDSSGPRAERRSPAAILGSKRIGEIVIPPTLDSAIEDAVASVDPHLIRQEYLQRLLPRTSKSAKARYEGNPDRREEKRREKMRVPAELVAQAATQLPRQFAAVRNVVEELERRLGKGWVDRAAESAWQARSSKAAKQAPSAQSTSTSADESAEETAREEGAASVPNAAGVVEYSAAMAPGLW